MFSIILLLHITLKNAGLTELQVYAQKSNIMTNRTSWRRLFSMQTHTLA